MVDVELLKQLFQVIDVHLLVCEQTLRNHFLALRCAVDRVLAEDAGEDVENGELHDRNVQAKDHNGIHADLEQRNERVVPVDAAGDRQQQREHGLRQCCPPCEKIRRHLTASGDVKHDGLQKQDGEDVSDKKQKHHRPEEWLERRHELMHHRAQRAHEPDHPNHAHDAEEARDACDPEDAERVDTGVRVLLAYAGGADHDARAHLHQGKYDGDDV
mmetsp:Transcript_96468/g.278433  ORF Transcript_96468/g.278433 Transcript_96468/m.278433 type:complete len:215 (-) Transcript_96468:760-1404(-)